MAELKNAWRIAPVPFIVAVATVITAVVAGSVGLWSTAFSALCCAFLLARWVLDEMLIDAARDLISALRRENRTLRRLLDLPTDAGSADARLLAALGLTAAALWVCYLAPVVAALVFLPAALVSAGVFALLLRAGRRRERVERDRAVVRSLARPVRPLTREQREAWERLRGQEWTT